MKPFTTGNRTEREESEKAKPLGVSPTNAQEKENNSTYGKMLNVIQIEGTPFTMVTIETNGKPENTFLSIGTSRITKLMLPAQARKLVKDKDWNITVSLITIVTERVMEQIKLEDRARNENTNQTKISFEEEAQEREK